MSLKKLRIEIDAIDKRILELLNERAVVTLKIGEVKHKKGLPIYSPDREKEVYEKIKKLNKGPLGNNALKAVYREIMSGSLSLEKAIKVAYLGPELTFTHLAAMEKFGSSVDYEPCSNITGVFNKVQKERCDYGVVPIENSTEGVVTHTMDMFMDSDLKICAEEYLRISHNLLSREGDIKKIKTVYSHPQVFGQCRVWLEINAPHVILKDTSSTSEAAMIASREKNSGCIASLLAKDKCALKTVAESIEDAGNNVTRFLIISKKTVSSTKNDKTSVMISLKDRVGGLHDILTPFKKNRINLTKIESRPSKKRAWQYYFFVDIEGHIEDEKIKKALKQVEKGCAFLKVLGSYPKGI